MIKNINKKTVIFVDKKFQLENEVEYLQNKIEKYKILISSLFIVIVVLAIINIK